ncbi:hypothetical protein H0V99_03580 [Candidatus Saccharibacteria bacterium]|nr:hypothetical protein [Candidatus Saccharibacteria bacterium]
MKLRLVRIYGILIAATGLVGLFLSGQILQLVNSDIAIDILRLVLAGYLLYVGFMAKDPIMAKTALLSVGLIYIGFAILGLISPTLVGVLPSGFTGLDIMSHLLSGAFAAYVGARDSQRYAIHS